MKKYLLPKNGNFYKANLHCHTNISDGKLSPEEIKNLYKENGYSIVAYTDHEVYITHNDLTDSDFLALNGMEIAFCEMYANKTYAFAEQCHLLAIALDKSIEVQPVFAEERHVRYNKHLFSLVNTGGNVRPLDKWYAPSCINFTIKTCNQKGFFTVYNHPSWSLENYSQYINYEGMHAMEMFNGGATALGYEDYNPRVYDDLLRSGKKLYAIGADDNHNKYAGNPKSPYSDAFKAFTMIKADNLDYESVSKALINGNFYASESPEIQELYYEDGKVYIKCSSAQKIYVSYGGRKAQVEYMTDKPLTSAEFEISKEHGYFRLTVVGLDGKRATTNAYYPSELDK
ncbi:MAG: PHP domain-containing protein [Clostridia bacterium]|nr:PHP domain-containing protein [Clostridia bacterium]